MAQTKISRVGAIEAAKAGGEAFRGGKALTDCPHSRTGDVGDEFLAHYWTKGYKAAQRAT